MLDLRFWLGICRTSLAVSALRIMRYCPKAYNKKFLKPYSNLLRFQELFICDLFGRERINQN